MSTPRTPESNEPDPADAGAETPASPEAEDAPVPPPNDEDAAPAPAPVPGDECQEDAEGMDVVDEAPPAPSEADLLREQIRALEARLRTVSAAFQQQTSEIAETRERLERQAAVREQRRRGEVVGALFEPVENLRRSLEAARAPAPGETTSPGAEGVPKSAESSLLSGLEMVLQQFMEALRRLGLEEVPGRGARFDPKLHEALAVVPVTDAALDGVVLEVYSAGYRIGETLVQPARVVIGEMQARAGEA